MEDEHDNIDVAHLGLVDVLCRGYFLRLLKFPEILCCLQDFSKISKFSYLAHPSFRLSSILIASSVYHINYVFNETVRFGRAIIIMWLF